MRVSKERESDEKLIALKKSVAEFRSRVDGERPHLRAGHFLPADLAWLLGVHT